MQKSKSLTDLLIIALILLCVSACAPKKVMLVGDQVSSIKAEVEKGGASAKVWIEKPNHAVDPILASVLSSKAGAKKAANISAFLDGMSLSEEIDEILVSKNTFEQALPGNNQDLNVVISFGLSSDLQVAGMHAAISLSSYANKGALTQCSDQFEIVAHSAISDKPEPFLGRDVRLINNYFYLRDLYRSMASDIADLIHTYYFNHAKFDFSKTARPIDIITYDHRIYNNVASAKTLSKAIAIKRHLSEDKLCKPAHLLAIDHRDVKAINDLVSLEKRDRRRDASKKKFQYQQSERNRALMHQRMRDRVLNK